MDVSTLTLKDRGLAYDSPIRLNVSSTMRIDSVEPLMEGEPLHDAAAGIASGLPRGYWQTDRRKWCGLMMFKDFGWRVGQRH